MQELIEAGYVYIAKPPLYKLKQGKRERYIEKEAELEELLVYDKLERFAIADREGAELKLTEARWQKLVRDTRQYESLAASLRGVYGAESVRFLGEAGILDHGADNAEAVIGLLATTNGVTSAHTAELVAAEPEELLVRVTERQSGFARTHRLLRAMFESNDYRQLVGVHRKLRELAGTPPFRVELGDKRRDATSFDDLRLAVLAIAQQGEDVSRFKGLGEMNADQLAETTMDPQSRTLAQVGIEDAVEADRIFSMLMGDQVEPRREFIESNARLVANLDV
jgi:DNA gyrase subunit B